MNSSKAKPTVTVQMMFAFGRACGKPLSSSDGASPYDQSSRRLTALGHSRNEGESEKAHCKRLGAVIDSIADGFYKRSKEKKSISLKAKKKSKSSQPIVAKQSHKPTQKSVQSYIAHKAVDPLDSGFLASFEWKATRMMAIKRYGPVCQCCGASPKTGAVINVDHIKPRKLFPHLALELDNLQVLCSDCNHGKGNWDQTDWRD